MSHTVKFEKVERERAAKKKGYDGFRSPVMTEHDAFRWSYNSGGVAGVGLEK
uniref:Uncharacterized protein n=1 Tax=Helianthus annuus TaxID=4232 RepID=A0A251V4G2_HELAN